MINNYKLEKKREEKTLETFLGFLQHHAIYKKILRNRDTSTITNEYKNTVHTPK